MDDEKAFFPLKTDRLTIRPLRGEDWREMQKIFADFAQSEYAIYDFPLPTDDRGAEALTGRFAGSGLFFAVTLPDGNMVGYIGFHRDGKAYDMGYCFRSAYQKKGYAGESAKALIEYLYRVYGVRNFTAGTALANLPSRRFLERLGFALQSEETLCLNGVPFRGGNFALNLP